jgi:N-acetylmuramoyl-L-alanine amidase
MRITGKCSSFGGPDDEGVSPSEGLAFIYDVSDRPEIFLAEQPIGTTGLARRLDPATYYVACRWDYDAPNESKSELLEHMALVRSTKTGKQFLARPGDWGPHEDTGRVADLSPGLMAALGIDTDDTVTVIYPFGQEQDMSIHRVAMSSGHGSRCAGASGLIEEHAEAVRVVNATAARLRSNGVTCNTFEDTTSTNQQQNLETIVAWHNSQTRDLDVFVHFNSAPPTPEPRGTECYYVTQEGLAGEVAESIALASGLINRGAKYGDLYVLNHTTAPAILVEICFVDSNADVNIYKRTFHNICGAIARAIAGGRGLARPPPPMPPAEADLRMVVALTVPEGVALVLTINGERVLLE